MNTIEKTEKFHFKTYKRYPITFKEGKGTILIDENGKEYLDFLAGIAVNSLGHSHPNVIQAIKKQAEKLMHVSNLFYTEPQADLAELLINNSIFDRAFFCNSGTEAIEAAVKLVRKYAHKNNRKGKIFALDNAFHGRTMAAIAMGKPKYQEGFGPMPDGFEILPSNDLDLLEKKITNDSIAVFIEPIQGEGGVIPIPHRYLQKVRNLCNKTGTLLVFDEIQCGMGRTGKLHAYEYFGVEPDIITLAKGMGGGFPIGAVLAKEEIANAFEPGNHGTTFGGNALAAATSYAVIKTLLDENIPQAANEYGIYFRNRLNEEIGDLDVVAEIRSAGLMIGIQLNTECAEVVKTMIDKGLITNCAAGKVIRIVPPLTVKKEEIDRAIDILVESIKEINDG